jgi:hypothetical protein
MLLILCEPDGEGGAAVTLYAGRYPQRTLPNSCTSHDINVRIRETGTARPSKARVSSGSGTVIQRP